MFLRVHGSRLLCVKWLLNEKSSNGISPFPDESKYPVLLFGAFFEGPTSSCPENSLKWVWAKTRIGSEANVKLRLLFILFYADVFGSILFQNKLEFI